jgi:hypothetical protein
MRMGAGGGSCDSFRDSRRRHLDCCRKRGDSLQTPETGRRGPNQRARIAALLGAERGRTALGARGVQGRGAPRPHLGIANLGKAPTGRCDGQALSRNGGPSGVDPRGQLLLCGRIIPTPVLVIDELAATSCSVQCMSQAGNLHCRTVPTIPFARLRLLLRTKCRAPV